MKTPPLVSRWFLRSLLPLATLAFAALPAQPIAVLTETFADGDRTNENLPASLAWFTTNSARANLAVRNGALTLVANDQDRTIWGYLPVVQLGLGDALTLTVEFRFAVTPPNLGGPGFRLALCSTVGTAPRRSDGGAPGAGYRGYGLFTNPGDATAGSRIRKRSGPAATTSTPLLDVTTGANEPIWETFGAAGAGLPGRLQGGITYTAVLRIVRTGDDSVLISASLAGGGLGANATLAESDPSGVYSNFDTIAINAAQTTAAGDLSLSRVQLVHEPNTTRLGNLSVLTRLPTAGDSFTLGYVVAGTGPKPLVIRAAGPSLGALGVPDTVEDPKIELFTGAARSGENDNWGGGDVVREAMAAVGAFPFTGPSSRDAAVALTLATRDNNSVRISAAGNGTGTVIAEIYDATPEAAFTAATPRLVNLSVLKHLGEGLTVGFFVAGTGARQVLLRAIGPTLGAAPFNVPGTVPDPRITLRAGSGVIATNDDWSGTAALTAAFARVGAFALPAVSRDAALVATLAPGSYTVQVSGGDGLSGVALVEVYELP